MAVDDLPGNVQAILRRALPSGGWARSSAGPIRALPGMGWANEQLGGAYRSARNDRDPSETINATVRITNTVVNEIEDKYFANPGFFTATKSGESRDELRDAIEHYDQLLAKREAVVAQILDRRRPENLVPESLEALRGNALAFYAAAERCHLYIVRDCQTALSYRAMFDSRIGPTQQLLQHYYPNEKGFWDHFQESLLIRNQAQALLGT